MKYIALAFLLSAALAGTAAAARSPAPVTATWFDHVLAQHHMLSPGGNDVGSPWMVDCEGFSADHAADNNTKFFHFRCLISLRADRYLQDYRTWWSGKDRVTWATEGRLWKLVPTNVGAP